MNRILPNNTARKVNNALPTAVANVANKTVNGVANAFNAVANNTKNVVQNSAKEAAAVMENAPAAMNDALFGVPEAVGNAVTNAANKMTNFASNAAKSVGNVVGNAATSVGNAANSVLNTVGLGNNSNRGNSNGNGNSNRNNSGRNNSNKGFFNSFKSNSGNNSVSNSVNSLLGNSTVSTGEGSFFASAWFIALIVLLTIFGIFVFFFDQIMELLPQSVRDGFNRLKEALGIPVEPAPPAPEPPAPEPPPPAPEEPGIIPGVPTPAYLPDSGAGDEQQPSGAQTLITDFEKIFEKQLPIKKEHKEVFNIKENRYKYEDAEPLCNALGAELATYEQVKEAYEHGADWCNYGWVKGQRAVYPTQPSTYEKMQKGPKEQRQACGKPGINGGYFDNPDLRFGVTCYGVKPPQKDHDKSLLPNGEANPFTPDALEYDKRVAEFKADSNNIGILPFSEKRWDEA